MADVVNFYEARHRLRPFAKFSDLWLRTALGLALAKDQPKWRVVLPDLRAEVRRRAQRKAKGRLTWAKPTNF